jgi:hypothetical protein
VSPQPTAVPLAALLRAEDVGPGVQPSREPELFENADRWIWGDMCTAYRSADYPSLPKRSDLRLVGFSGGVSEIVERYADGWGIRNMADVRDVLRRCARPSVPAGVAPQRYTIVDSAVAGDESLLVKHEAWFFGADDRISPDPHVTYIAVVRVRDLVATIVTPGPEQQIRTIAQRAAVRLGT